MKELEIKDLYTLNRLDEECGMMVNHTAIDKKYDYYMFNKMDWLLDHKDEIENDFASEYKNRFDDYCFDIMMSSKYIGEYKLDCFRQLKRMPRDKQVKKMAGMFYVNPLDGLKGNGTVELNNILDKIFFQKYECDALRIFDELKRK